MMGTRWISRIRTRLRRTGGSVAVIRCTQRIPCNPCEDACPNQAIRIGGRIVNRPVLRASRCTGCGLCIPACPGLAIRVVDRTHSSECAAVKIPHEFLPLPKRGDCVTILNGRGEPLCAARVIDMINPPRNDRTAVIEVAVPHALANEAMSIAISEEEQEWTQQP